MTKVTILRGVPGCGKSTWAKAQAGSPAIVSRDSLRIAIFGSCDQDYYKVDKNVLSAREAVVTGAQNAAIETALRKGRDVIIDNTNIEWKFVKEFAKIAAKYDAKVEVKVFDISLTLALMQNKMRDRVVPEDVIRKMHSSFQSNKHMVLEDVINPGPVPYDGTPGKPKAFMYDLDGTAYHMNGKRGPFDINVDVDDPDEHVLLVIRSIALSTGWVPIAMSGRKEVTRAKTQHAMTRDGFLYRHLFMRADDDNRSDNLVKTDLFDEHVRDNFDVQFVIDDRWQVCEMWLQMGLKVFNVSGLDRGEF